MVDSDNLLACVGFVEKWSNSSRIKYKLDFTQTKSILGSKGVRPVILLIFQ